MHGEKGAGWGQETDGGEGVDTQKSRGDFDWKILVLFYY